MAHWARRGPLPFLCVHKVIQGEDGYLPRGYLGRSFPYKLWPYVHPLWWEDHPVLTSNRLFSEWTARICPAHYFGRHHFLSWRVWD